MNTISSIEQFNDMRLGAINYYFDEDYLLNEFEINKYVSFYSINRNFKIVLMNTIRVSSDEQFIKDLLIKFIESEPQLNIDPFYAILNNYKIEIKDDQLSKWIISLYDKYPGPTKLNCQQLQNYIKIKLL